MRRLIRIAYRRASGIVPKDTLSAFSKALEIGIDWVELDVHGTAYSEVVVMHAAAIHHTGITDDVIVISFHPVDRMRKLIDFGVQGITSNYPDLFEAI
jgi:glycerophosphoryl diester phosphodiesterase